MLAGRWKQDFRFRSGTYLPAGITRPGHTWGNAPTQGALTQCPELTENELLDGEEQYSGKASWKGWIKFGHVGLVEGGGRPLPSRGTIVGNQ